MTDTMKIDDVEINDEIQQKMDEALEERMFNVQYAGEIDDFCSNKLNDDHVVFFIHSFGQQPLEADIHDPLQLWVYDYETLAKTASWDVVQRIVDDAELQDGLFDVGVREVDGEGCTRSIEFHMREVERSRRSTLEHILEDVFKTWMDQS